MRNHSVIHYVMFVIGFGIAIAAYKADKSHFVSIVKTMRQSTPMSPTPGSLTSQAQAVILTCPPITNVCPTDTPPLFTLASFLMAGGSISSPCGIDSNSFRIITTNTVPGPINSLGIICNITTSTIYSINDSCGGSDSCTHTIQRRDNITPQVECPGLTVLCASDIPLQFNTFSSWFNNLISTGGSINGTCSGIDTSSFIFLGRSTTSIGNCIATVQDRYSIFDSCGNGAICVRDFTINSLILPTFTPAKDTLIYVDNSCIADTFNSKTGTISNASHPCGIGSINYNDITKTGCLGIDTIIRVWSVADNCGRTAKDSQYIFIKDTIRPIASITPAIINVDCSNLAPAPNPDLVVATDNCTSPVVTHLKDSVTDSTCISKKTIHRIYIAKDSCNNTTRVIHLIRVNDTIAPTLVCPASFSVACNSQVPVPNGSTINVDDNCLGDYMAKFLKDSVIAGVCTNKKTIFRIYTATDTCKNTGRCIQIIRVNDSIPPAINCPTNLSVECTDAIPAFDINVVIATDNCGNAIKIHVKDSITDSTCINGKIIHRIYMATDSCSNTLRCIQRITLDDNTPPSAICPNNTSVVCIQALPLPNPGLVMSTDNCGLSPMTQFVKDTTIDSLCIHNKTIIRRYLTTDACGNTTPCTQSILILDGDLILTGVSNAQILTCGDEFEIIFPSALSNCDQSQVLLDIDTVEGSCPGNYLILLQFKSTDVCMNTATRTDTVTYIDDTPPMITCPANKRIDCFIDPVLPIDSFLVSDACGVDSASFGLIDENISIENNEILISRIYSISDLCGNNDSCTQLITAPLCFADLALRAVINAGDPYIVKPGGEVPACFTIYNQGFVPVDSIKVIQYLQKGISIISPGWTLVNDTTACTYVSIANGKLPMDGLQPGDTVKINFVLWVSPTVNFSVAISVLEINQIRDLNFLLISDIDSEPDDDKTNDTGGIPLSPDDNEIHENGRMGDDEDDHDPILFYVAHPLVCINNESVSAAVNLECKGCITPYDVLKGILLPEEFYHLVIYDPFGKELPLGNCIGREYLGYTLTYKVSIPRVEPNNFCWGRITLEDKSPPLLDCENDTIYCYEINDLPVIPDAFDNCSGPSKVNIINVSWKDYGCDTPGIKGVYTRTLESHDVWNNTALCEKKYYIRTVDLQDILCPRDTSIDCLLEVDSLGVKFTDIRRAGVPTIDGIRLYPNNVTCNVFSTYQDDTLDICGYGYKIKRTWILIDHCTQTERECIQYIKIEDKSNPIIKNLTRIHHLVSDAHDCYALLDLPKQSISDCSNTIQRFVFTYFEPDQVNIVMVQSGLLPARLKIPLGSNHKIYIDITDDCGNFTKDSILVHVTDQTPPTPVCDEFTQITLDPDACWGQIIASELDNGSHDNCCETLHFAAAYMEDIDSARAQFSRKIIAECGNKDYWDNKAWYDDYINEWINCFVFKDKLQADSCGRRQVVLRVYEACDLPRYDEHVFACSPHAWYCYNTSWLYRVMYNKEFRPTGSQNCKFRAPWYCKSRLINHFDSLNFYNYGAYQASAINKSCDDLFASTNSLANCKRKPLYNDCMINVLMDDKTAPHCENLSDITIYCDSVPDTYNKNAWTICNNDIKNGSTLFPGEIKLNGIVHGYYGGHKQPSHDEHDTPVDCGYDEVDNWAPIYCIDWLKLDRYDSNEKFNPNGLFFKPVRVDKNNPKRTLTKGEFYVIDNCILGDVNSKDESHVDVCGTGWYKRTWTVKDKCGNETICSQKIIVKHRSDFEVIFPKDEVVYCESLKQQTSPNNQIINRPVVSDDDCERMGIRYKDDTFKVVDDACYKILRKWIITDDCIFEPNQHIDHPDVIVNDSIRANSTDRYCVYRNLKDNGDGYMHYIQVIKVVDTSGPKIEVKDTTFCITDESCVKALNLPIKTSDLCSNDLWYNLYIDKNNDGSIDETLRSIRTLNGAYPEGIYKIRVEAFDHCYNKSEGSFVLTVKDCKAPTPYCINGIATVIMPSSGNLLIWAKDLNLGSTDNCTATNDLIFTFDSAGLYLSDTITCKDLPNGIAQPLDVNIYVWDKAGNKDFCRTYVLIQDNPSIDKPQGACPDVLGSLININGELMDESNEPIEKATVKLKTNSIHLPDYTTTSNGKFSFHSVPLKGEVSIVPNRNDDPMNGISTLDLLLIEKHIKGDRLLSSPYKIIAADVNKNNSIDVIDILELRKLILGIYDKFPESDSWRFIPMNHTFSNVSQPWPYPSEYKVTSEKVLNVPFMGIKVGDVNNSSTPHSLLGTEIRESADGLILNILDQKLRTNDVVEVGISSDRFDHILGFQGTLIHHDMELVNVKSGTLNLNTNQFNTASSNRTAFSWHSPQSVTAKPSDILFTLVFKVKKSGILSERLLITSNTTEAESYNAVNRIQSLALKFIDRHGSTKVKSELYQNYPNPFSEYTTIGIKLQKTVIGKLTIHDIAGKTLKIIEKTWDKGYQEIRLNKNELGATGILYYKFESSDFNATKKMIQIE